MTFFTFLIFSPNPSSLSLSHTHAQITKVAFIWFWDTSLIFRFMNTAYRIQTNRIGCACVWIIRIQLKLIRFLQQFHVVYTAISSYSSYILSLQTIKNLQDRLIRVISWIVTYMMHLCDYRFSLPSQQLNTF